MDRETIKTRQLIFGWTALAIVTVVGSLWAYWGGVENFYEGWYSESLWENRYGYLAFRAVRECSN